MKWNRILKWNRTMRKFCCGQLVIPILYRDTNFLKEATWIKHCMFSMYLCDIRCACLMQSTTKTKNAASSSVVALPAYTHTNAHSHTRKTVLLAPYLGVSDNPMMLFTVWQPWNWCEVWWEGTAADFFWIQSYSEPMMAETQSNTMRGFVFVF